MSGLAEIGGTDETEREEREKAVTESAHEILERERVVEEIRHFVEREGE